MFKPECRIKKPRPILLPLPPKQRGFHCKIVTACFGLGVGFIVVSWGLGVPFWKWHLSYSHSHSQGGMQIFSFLFYIPARFACKGINWTTISMFIVVSWWPERTFELSHLQVIIFIEEKSVCDFHIFILWWPPKSSV